MDDYPHLSELGQPVFTASWETVVGVINAKRVTKRKRCEREARHKIGVGKLDKRKIQERILC